MAKEYVEQRDGNYYVAGTRVSLDSLVHAFRRGESPETISQNFDTLDLEEVYGAIAYYYSVSVKYILIQMVELPPSMDNRRCIDLGHTQQDSIVQFLPGLHPDVAQERAGHFAEQCLG